MRVLLRFHLLAEFHRHLFAVGDAVVHRIVPVAFPRARALAGVGVVCLPVGTLLVNALTLAGVVVHAPVPGTEAGLGTETLAQDLVQFEGVGAALRAAGARLHGVIPVAVFFGAAHVGLAEVGAGVALARSRTSQLYEGT